MLNDLKGRAVLVTGGTRGIGLATGLAFGRQGAQVTLTHKWGSADEDAIRKTFSEAGALEPLIFQADARDEPDTAALMANLHRRFERIEVFVSGVAFAQVVKGLADYNKRSFGQSMEYTVWPMASYMKEIRSVFGNYPRYTIGLSSDGPDVYMANYDIVATCKAALETLSRYLAFRVLDADARVNIVRARFVATDSFDKTAGPEFVPFAEKYDPGVFVQADAVANAILALCSGLMDAVNGQVVMIDNGTAFADNLMGLYHRWHGHLPS